MEIKRQIRPTEHDLTEEGLRAVEAAVPGAEVEETGARHEGAVGVHVGGDGDVLVGGEFVDLYIIHLCISREFWLPFFFVDLL